MNIFTIGHSNHNWETFLPLLREHNIELLVDVRSKPVSRFAPFANKSKLPELLGEAGMAYAFMGNALGGRPANQELYDESAKPDYSKMALQLEFQESIQQLVNLALVNRLAIMCSEENPTQCHRRLLVGTALQEHGVSIIHIRKDGTPQSEGANSNASESKQATLPLQYE